MSGANTKTRADSRRVLNLLVTRGRLTNLGVGRIAKMGARQVDTSLAWLTAQGFVAITASPTGRGNAYTITDAGREWLAAKGDERRAA